MQTTGPCTMLEQPTTIVIIMQSKIYTSTRLKLYSQNNMRGRGDYEVTKEYLFSNNREVEV